MYQLVPAGGTKWNGRDWQRGVGHLPIDAREAELRSRPSLSQRDTRGQLRGASLRLRAGPDLASTSTEVQSPADCRSELGG